MNDHEHAQMLLALAQRDLDAISAMLDSEVFHDSIFGFHAQQAIEKALKACCAEHHVTYPNTHDLELLASLLEDGGIQLAEKHFELVRFGEFGVLPRYHFVSHETDLNDREQIITEIKQFLLFVNERINRPKD